MQPEPAAARRAEPPLPWLLALVENAPDALFAVGADGVVQLVNAEAERLTGYPREALVGHPVERLLPERLRSGHAALRSHFTQHPERRAMGRDRLLALRRRDGTEVLVEVALAPLEVEGEVPVVLAAVRDVTLRRRAEEERRRAQEDLEAYQRVLVGIARGEPRDVTLDVLCREVEQRYPGTRVTVLVADRSEGCLWCAAAPSMPQAFNDAIDRLPIAHGMGACGHAAATGRMVVVEDVFTDPLTEAWVDLAREHAIGSVWSQPLLDASGRALGTFAVYRGEPHTPDASEIAAVTLAAGLAELAVERSAAERALTRAAERDPLTRLPNRASFLGHLADALDGGDDRLAVLFLDLDRFKWINDSLGHPAGDRILVDVAQRLSAALDPRVYLARFGGDEFTALVADATPARLAETAARIEAAFAEPFVLDGGEFFLSVSIGISLNDHPSDGFGLVRDADAAMYVAKERGRARHVMFDEGMRERAVQRVTRETELRRAVERHEMVLHYQPVWDPGQRRWTALEALVRWQHPELGLLGPGEFIPLAEDTGLIVPLGSHLLDLALSHLSGPLADLPPVRVGVNVSVVQLADPDFGTELAALLDKHGVDPERLFLEVTESGLMEHLDVVRRSLEHAVGLGVQVVVDDFGTGYSSIARLGQLPVAGVKIDQSFTKNLGQGGRAERVMAAMTELAHAHDLYVVAEGIETEQAYAHVRELCCEGAQGYLLAVPVALDELPAVLLGTPTTVAG